MYRSIEATTRFAMKAAVSCRIQMNSSARLATSTDTVPTILRSAIRKIGTSVLRARTSRSSVVAALGLAVSLAPSDQSIKMHWIAASEAKQASASSNV